MLFLYLNALYSQHTLKWVCQPHHTTAKSRAVNELTHVVTSWGTPGLSPSLSREMCVSKDVSKMQHRIPGGWNPRWFKYCKQYDLFSLAVPLDSLFQACESELATGPSFWGMSHPWEAETVPQTPVSWSSWSRKAAQPSSTFWAMEGYCKEPQNTVLDVTEQKQQIGNVLTTKLCVEGQVKRVNYSPKQALSSLHWPSSVWFY